MEFRTLKANEIECRIATVKSNGISLLLYKDARCDMNILDETVGKLNWKREHSRDNANCTVSIWDGDKGIWVPKEDTGTESFTEKEKGLASDSFKRACFNWGIGRELYTAPFIWIPSDKCEISAKQNGNGSTCYDRFRVSYVGYDKERNIDALKIENEKTGKVVFSLGRNVGNYNPANQEEPLKNYVTESQVKTLEICIPKHKQTIANVCRHYKVSGLRELTVEQFKKLMRNMGEE